MRDARDRGREPSFRQRRRVDPARQLAQLVDRRRQLGDRRVERIPGRVRAPTCACEAQREQDCDEPLLRAVVEVPLEPLPCLVRRRDDAGARVPHLRLVTLALRHVRRREEEERARSRSSAAGCTTTDVDDLARPA